MGFNSTGYRWSIDHRYHICSKEDGRENREKIYKCIKNRMSTDQQPLSSLAQTAKTDCEKKEVSHEEHGYGYGGYFAWAILWFIILAVIIWLILVASKPTWVQRTDQNGKPTGEVDNGKAVLWAIVIAFIICIIIWILRALAGWGGQGGYETHHKDY